MKNKTKSTTSFVIYCIGRNEYSRTRTLVTFDLGRLLIHPSGGFLNEVYELFSISDSSQVYCDFNTNVYTTIANVQVY